MINIYILESVSRKEEKKKVCNYQAKIFFQYNISVFCAFTTGNSSSNKLGLVEAGAFKRVVDKRET